MKTPGLGEIVTFTMWLRHLCPYLIRFTLIPFNILYSMNPLSYQESVIITNFVIDIDCANRHSLRNNNIFFCSSESQPQQSSSSTTQNETTALTVPELPGRTLHFVLPVKLFHGHGQKMEPPVSSLSDRLLVTTPFIPVDRLLGPCMYVPPDKKQS